ncbi:hypothetical protein [Proteus phage vB_PmiP_RS1pmA]|uniref:Uncharacterized protein n=1 Tax=Proteus phage vB_PmiP_RS1pmA TaxID=2250312 RepID=A0A514CY13_9CAUD|nr:hypothetical protein [Proteus phage vB_PmiP_RS1pmA]
MDLIIAFILIGCTYIGLFYWVLRLESTNSKLRHSLELEKECSILIERKYQLLLKMYNEGKNV